MQVLELSESGARAPQAASPWHSLRHHLAQAGKQFQRRVSSNPSPQLLSLVAYASDVLRTAIDKYRDVPEALRLQCLYQFQASVWTTFAVFGSCNIRDDDICSFTDDSHAIQSFTRRRRRYQLRYLLH